MNKKILCFVLAICLIIPCVFMLSACKDNKDSKIETWDGTTIEVSDAVDGVITIETAEELAGFAKAVNAGSNFAGKTIILACDMDMAGKTWTPIGLGVRSNVFEANVFSGTFDGNGKKIIGLNNGEYAPAIENKKIESNFSTEVHTYQYGLFGITENATIKNLTVTVDFDCDEETLKGDSVGGLVGFANKSLTIENCVVNGSVEGYDAIGGLVGCSYKSSEENKVIIKNSVNNAEVEALYKASGIIGYVNSENLNLTIDNCTNNGTIEVDGMIVNNTFVSMVSGIVNYGWKANSKNTVILTNNKNCGVINACEDLSQDKTNFHSYAYVANSVDEVFNNDYHNYDFTGNSNEGKVYYNETEATDALIVVHTKSYPEYVSENEYNNKTNILN